jgi:hypothetical protein
MMLGTSASEYSIELNVARIISSDGFGGCVGDVSVASCAADDVTVMIGAALDPISAELPVESPPSSPMS